MLNPMRHLTSHFTSRALSAGVATAVSASVPVVLPIVLSMAITVGAASPVLAQLADEEAPVVIHRQIDSGVAGELQTFLARVSDDVGVEKVVLHYRQSDAGSYQSIAMRPLLDSIGEYMIAIETSVTAYQGLQYYIEATDVAGNTTNRGFSYAPIVLPLTAPVVRAQAPTPGPVVPPGPEQTRQSDDGGFAVNPTVLVVGLGALVALGALAASGGGDGESNPVPTDPGTDTPTVTLTLISDRPSAD